MLKKIFSSDFARGTLTLFIFMNIFNFLNFLFHFSMGRLLGPADYGVLAVLMSLAYIYVVPVEALQNIASRYTSLFNVRKENGKIKFFMIKTLRKGFAVSGVLFILALIIGFFLADFLKIDYWMIAITNLLVFTSFSVPVARGILQGKKKFKSLGISLIVESGLRLILALLFVYLGFAVFGAVTGVVIGSLIGLVISIYFTRDILKIKEEKFLFNKAYSKSVPYFVAILVIFLVFSLDILLARRFFSAEFAGQYAVLSMIGKIIFLGTMAISKAMFPLTSEKNDSNEDPFDLAKKSFLTVGFMCLIAVGIFAFFPKFLILILYGSQYIIMAPYLIYSGIAFSFLSLSNLVLIYGLSTNRLRKPYFLFVFLAIEIILLYFFHGSILEYVKAFMVSNIVMFIGSLFFVRKSKIH